MPNFEKSPAIRWLEKNLEKINAVMTAICGISIAGVGAAVTSRMYSALINPHSPDHKAVEIVTAGFVGATATFGWMATNDVMKAFVPAALRPAERLSARFASMHERVSAYVQKYPRTFKIGAVVAIETTGVAFAIHLHTIAPVLSINGGLMLGYLSNQNIRPQGPTS